MTATPAASERKTGRKYSVSVKRGWTFQDDQLVKQRFKVHHKNICQHTLLEDVEQVE